MSNPGHEGEVKTGDESPVNPITCLANSIEYFTASLPELMLTGEFCDETWQRIMGPP